jgi:hypothetical protein
VCVCVFVFAGCAMDMPQETEAAIHRAIAMRNQATGA